MIILGYNIYIIRQIINPGILNFRDTVHNSKGVTRRGTLPRRFCVIGHFLLGMS